MTEPTLRELFEQRFDSLETLINERRENDLRAVALAKHTADAALKAHNDLIKRGETQARESQRQLDKLTDTYATLDNLTNLETLLDQRLISIEGKVDASAVAKQAVRTAWYDLKGVILLGFVILGSMVSIATYFAQQ